MNIDPAKADTTMKNPTDREPIRVDGFAQIVAMLQVADDDFRESLLKRLAIRDPLLVENLRRTLRGNA